MWVQAGFPPGEFYEQTPRHFQLAMQGTRKRLEGEYDNRLTSSYETAVFVGLAQVGKLKKLAHYQRKRSAQTPREMVEMLQVMGTNSDMRITRVRLSEA